MRILIEHLKLRTIPHDLIEYFVQSDVPFYEGCMIVQVHDHKSAAPSQNVNKVKSGASKVVPFSVHNYNKFLTPSSYVPYPTDNALTPKEEPNEDEKELKLSDQKDKENMPAPSLPGEQRSESQTKKVSVSTIVLHPTELTKHIELSLKLITPRSSSIDGRSDSTVGLQSAVPQTPITAVPSTPLTSMPPPAKKQKKAKMELDGSTFHAAEAQITLATTAPLVLDPVDSAAESARLLEALAHPMHSEKPPLPKARKRTVAEMAADEALAADQERYMLLLDERLSSNLANSKGGANASDADGQAGGISFEPRFERFKVIENIKIQHAEAKKQEKLRQQEAERKQAQDREREKIRLEAEKREQEKLRALQIQQQQQQQQQAAQRQQQEAHRRALAAQQQAQGMANMAQPQMQHGHPQQAGMMPNGMQSQPQRFQQQQVSQSQMSSPVARNGTPQGHSSPVVNNMGNVPMQPSTSSMGGSPPRPGSVVQQNHVPSGPGSHGMSTQRSQQSHTGTPRMPNSTPQIQNTPLNRQMSQTPRMSQASPLQGVSMPQMPQQMTPMMIAGQPMNLNPAQQAQFNQQQLLQQRLMRQNQQAAAQGMGNMMNGQQLTPAQQQLLQAQQMLQRQQNPMQQNQLPQNYAAQVAAMSRAQGQNMQQNMPQNFMNGNNGMPNMQQMQQMQQPHITQAQMQQAAQQQIYQAQVTKLASSLYQQGFSQLQQQYPNGVPEDIVRNLRLQCNQNAVVQVQNSFRRRMAAQHAAQQMQQNMNVMHNGMGMGMGMQRPQGM